MTVLETLQCILSERNPGVRAMLYTGTMNINDRESTLKEFTKEEDGPMLLLASISAGNCGINLTPCATCFIVDLSMNPFTEIQAINRVHRLTQKNEVKILRFYMKGMVEEMILKSQQKKLTEAKSIGLTTHFELATVSN